MHGPHYETSRCCAVVACSSSGVPVECERGIERSSNGGAQQRPSFVLFLACCGSGGGGGCCFHGGVVAAVVVFCVWWCGLKAVLVIMSICVPHWDSRGVTPEDGMPSNEYLELEGKGDITRYKRSQLSQFATVPDQYTVELPWTTDGHVDMQGQNNKGNKSQWQTNYNSNWKNGQETEDGVTPSKPPTSKDSTLEAVVSAPPSEAPAAPVTNAQDDEMLCYLQYPLDDTLEKTYCSDFFGELRKSDMPLHGIPDSFSGGHARAQRMPHHGSAGNDTAVNRTASAEAAMLMGAGRAAGLLPQNGAEAFSKVRTLQNVQPPNPSKSWQFHNPMSAQGPSARTTTSRIAPTPMLPPKSQPITDGRLSGHPARLGPMNFSHFLRPAALVNANLHSLALNSTPPPAARIKLQLGKPVVEASASSGSSIAESTTTGRSKMDSQRDSQVQLGSTESEQQNGVGDSMWPVHSSPVFRKETREVSEEGLMKSSSKPVDQDACHISSVTGSALPNSSEKAGSQRTQLPDAQEPTITSSSGGSGTSAQKAKEPATSIKRKSRENEDGDCHSEEGEEESVDLKKQQQPAPGRGSTAKRSRAAEVHNLSERRRRDRINEKMKALQELIPNSNKTDKASMLDEAIEYLKMLQLQLQMMSMRSGMSLPPMVMPQAMQHPMQMSQMTAIPPMAMGMMGMQGMIGMSMMDLGQPVQARSVVPMLSHGGPSHEGGVSSSLNPADGHDPRLHTSSAMETINACLPHQHQPMQMPSAMNLEMYNAYVLQQHQHHHHHQTPNMSWGPPQ